jgi:succinate dehydrogenase/fumarate reductase flavoprotein subunit
MDQLLCNKGDIPTAALRDKMQKVNQSNAAVFRTGPVLQEGIKKLEDIYSDMKHIKVGPIHL